ncbi:MULTISPECIES: DUF1837 domain-containing protein [Vibrio]|uniref:DUF1837 domain-containing protein n=1 Tax=Vibrio splendidus TaxID=29497 RepID=A0A2T5EW55_VIBSP|nr:MULTISPECIES: DUF1837 domain-containing protein [Vibrio]MBE8576901.1 DUF1837 domain-containing protein [Vibrio sp. OPT18]MBU2909468.1 DUF1837 domain-containing protein [Vibrio splendidus]MDO6529410.1 DUF1837 domain-containing protein [Vibrio splendidus]MDO6550465.1 DUF1837 domain-containing protein [Vibrio splendidus]PTP35349.1 DUF1837 domain-containing protein [Vibrio splendidus]
MEDNLDTIGKALTDMARGELADLTSLLATACTHNINENKIDCYYLKVDANGRPRLNELIKYMCMKITDYTIPRSKINKATKKLIDTGCTNEITKIALDARKLFTKLELTGEGGELLLFALTESILKFPQVLCKMSLKSDEQMHFHGADGVFLGVDDDDMLCVYWGESKLHATHSSAISECITSIASILKMEPDVDSDIRLVDYIDLDNSTLEGAIKNYFDYTSPRYEKLRPCAVCLVSFNHSSYEKSDSKLTNEGIKKKIEQDFLKHWKKNIEAKLKENDIEHTKVIFFYLPINSVDGFRDTFRTELGLQ